MSYTIRVARPDDAARLTELAMASKAHWGYSDKFMQACREELTVTEEQITSEEFECLVASRSDAIAGFYALQWDAGVDVELAALFVEPDQIGTGVGRALIQHAIQRARDAGAERIIIQGDPNAQAFYQAAGARQIGQRESDSIAGRFLPLFEILTSRS